MFYVFVLETLLAQVDDKLSPTQTYTTWCHHLSQAFCLHSCSTNTETVEVNKESDFYDVVIGARINQCKLVGLWIDPWKSSLLVLAVNWSPV